MDKVLFSSASIHWATPIEVYEALHKEFHFDFDPCPLNADFDGLTMSWENKRVFCNPPYGRGIDKWLAKAREARCSVFLLPSRTDTKWWHDYAMEANEIRFLRGRLKFGGHKNPAPFPSVVLIYHGSS